MLHILLLTLKAAGLIIAALLGILLVLLLLVLLVPVRCRLRGQCGAGRDSNDGNGVGASLGDTSLLLTVTWLLGIVRGTVAVQNKSADLSIRIAWKRLGAKTENPETGDNDSEEGRDLREGNRKSGVEAVGNTEKEAANPQREEKPEPMAEGHPSLVGGAEENLCEAGGEPRLRKEAAEELGNPAHTTDADDAASSRKRKEKTAAGAKKSGWVDAYRRLWEKIAGIPQKIKCTIREICDKIKKIAEKKERLTAFVTDEQHLLAFGKLKRELFRLAKHLRPSAVKASIRFGFDDPALTGTVLALLGICYPLVGGAVNITPDFGREMLEGEVDIKARVRVLHITAVAVRLLLCSELRRTVRDIRHFQ